jgi:hypothetical protein
MRKVYYNMSYVKTGDPINKTARSPLIMGRREWAELVGIGRGLEIFEDLRFGVEFREGEYT